MGRSGSPLRNIGDLLNDEKCECGEAANLGKVMKLVFPALRMTDFNYPECRRDEDVVEEMYGTMVADPYRHLEVRSSRWTVGLCVCVCVCVCM